PDTKLMQNSGRTTFKRTSIDQLMNILVLCLRDYMGTQLLVWLFLCVSVEMIRLGNSFFIDWDRKMYYLKKDTPAQARTTTLNEELGQIKYIFSDKTGTLTQNIMTFNKCSINGKNYAVEDKLQDGVPQTIEQLAKADMKIWVLTGDKQETAENIGYSCNMLRNEMKEIFIIAANTADGVKEELHYLSRFVRNARRKMCPGAAEKPTVIKARAGLLWLQKTQTVQDENVNGEYGLIINGHSLAYALQKDLKFELLRTACMCQTVICCRVTPLQKAQVVELVKKYKQTVTLAIGDGANDVSMIRAAHIGVGISGQEGMQAVLSSDFSFAQFRYLQRLLLVHGRWSYIRMCKFLRYFFYKNFTYTLIHFWYAFFSGFSAQDVNDRWSLKYPQLYSPGQLNKFFSKNVFVRCVMRSCYTSLVLFFIPWAAMHDTVRDDGKDIVNYQRVSTRRSSYAFSHSQGYGDLVTSRKFLRLKSRPSLFGQKDSPVVENQPQVYRTITEETEESQS
ncbi:hypothetical protein XENOCAPTIV_024900, partial [Xenoophorus captivus]